MGIPSLSPLSSLSNMYVIRIEFKMKFNSRFNKNITLRKTLVPPVILFAKSPKVWKHGWTTILFGSLSLRLSHTPPPPSPHAPTTPKTEKGKDLGEKLEVCSMPSNCISYIVLHAKVPAINWSYVYDLEYLHENAQSRPKKGRTVSANQLRWWKLEWK